MQNKSYSWHMTTLIILLLGAYALRLSYLGTDSIWHDEAWSIRAFQAPFTTPDDNTPYLYYIVGNLFLRMGIGEHPLALRYVSLMIGLVTVALAVRVGKGWFGRRWGWPTGALVALSPLLWAYAQEVRAYIAVPLIIVILIFCVDAILKFRRGESVPFKWWLAIFSAQVVGLYTHNLIAPALVWVNVALGMAWLYRRDWRKMLIWSGVEIGAIIAYIPWLLTQSPSGTTLNTVPTFSLGLIQDIWASYFLPVPQQLVDAQSTLFYPFLTALGVGFVLSVVGWLLSTERNARTWLLVSHVICLPLFTIILMIVASIDFHPRYMIGGVMGMILIGVASLHGLLQHRQTLARLTVAIVLSVAGLLCAVAVSQIRSSANYRHDDFRGLAQYYATLPEDAVILVPFNAERALQDYYAVADHLGITIKAQFINIPLYSDEQTALDVINALVTDIPRHVEFLTWYQLPADVRGMYPCLLGGASQSAGEMRLFHGLATQAYYLTHAVEWQILNTTADFATAQQQSIAYIPTYDGACIRTDWKFPDNHPYDAHATFTLLNPFDQPISRTDETIRSDHNATVGNWDADIVGSAYGQLSLPDGAPLQDYTLLVGVYDDENSSGFDVLDDAGNPAGKVLRYKNAITAQGRMSDATQSALLDDNSVDDVVYTGLPLNITAFVHSDDRRLTLRSEAWLLEVDEQIGVVWAQWIIPAGYDGSAELWAGERLLKRYQVVDIPRNFERPTVDLEVGTHFSGVGELVGMTYGDDAQTVTFVWRADGSTAVSYTVFAQYLGEDGTVIAQSDRIPAQDTRPTIGWVMGEYILDTHTFEAVLDGQNIQLIVGFYDARTFERVLTDTGKTFAVIMP